MEHADELLAAPPTIEQVDVLAAKLPEAPLDLYGKWGPASTAGRSRWKIKTIRVTGDARPLALPLAW